MDLEVVQQSLSGARTGADWVGRIAEFLDAGDLEFGHGTNNAADEAYWLVRALQDWDERAWRHRPDASLIPAVVAILKARVVDRKPLAYLLGEAWFAGIRFNVDERVLIPRSPLAELIERGFKPWCRLAPGERVLDLGTGSGCLAIATAHYCPEVIVDAVDVSADAIDIARGNVTTHDLADRVHVQQSDLFAAVTGPYRVILSNPPYVPDERLRALPKEYAYEPRLALAGGERGLDVVTKILEQAPEHLTDDGVLIVEVGEAQGSFVQRHERLPVTWLEFERGGEGVFVLTRDELTGYLAG